MHELAVIGNPRRKRDAKGRFLKRSKASSGKRRRGGKRRSVKASAAATVKRRRSRSSSTRKSSRRPRTSIVTVTRRYRSNPRSSVRGIVALVTDALLPSAIAAGGALAVDFGLGNIPLPEKLKTGPVRHATRAAFSIVLGVLASFVVKPVTAAQILSGGLTVTFHQAAREALARAAPKLRLAELEDDGVSAFEQQVAELLEDERSMGALTYEDGVGAFESPFTSASMAAVDEGYG